MRLAALVALLAVTGCATPPPVVGLVVHPYVVAAGTVPPGAHPAGDAPRIPDDALVRPTASFSIEAEGPAEAGLSFGPQPSPLAGQEVIVGSFVDGDLTLTFRYPGCTPVTWQHRAGQRHGRHVGEAPLVVLDVILQRER